VKKWFFLVLLMPLFIFQITNGASTDKLFIGLASDKLVYKNTDTIVIALTVLNQNSATSKVTFTSGREYDFYLFKNDHLIWKWSQGMMFTMALSNLILEPQRPLTYVTTFNPKLSSGQTIEPGRYKLFGAFCTKDKEYLSEPVEIEIKN
jgi:hypothetical protein